MTDSQTYLCIHMGLIKKLARPLPLQRQVATHWECISWKREGVGGQTERRGEEKKE